MDTNRSDTNRLDTNRLDTNRLDTNRLDKQMNFIREIDKEKKMMQNMPGTWRL